MKKTIVNLKRFVILIKILGISQATRFLVQLASGVEVIELRINGISTPLFCRSCGPDKFNLMQTFWKRGLDVDLQEAPRLIVDGGAYVGYTSLFLANRYPDARIIAIEPDVHNCRLFRQNCRFYPNIQLLQRAIWDKRTYLEIENPQDQSWEFRVRETSAGTSRSIQSITIPEIVALANEKPIDVLKLDIEGTEKRLFSSDITSWISNVNNIIIELHDRYVQGCSEALFDVAEKYGFDVSQSGEYLVLKRNVHYLP
jgi:FkbM family methyltransferase